MLQSIENTCTRDSVPKMMTIKQVASTGLLPEHALRTGVKEGWVPCIKSASRVYINYDKLIEVLQNI